MGIISLLNLGVTKDASCVGGGSVGASMSIRTPAMSPMLGATITMGSIKQVLSTSMLTIPRPTPTATMWAVWWRRNSILVDKNDFPRQSLITANAESGFLSGLMSTKLYCELRSNTIFQKVSKVSAFVLLARILAKCCPPRCGLVG